MNLDRLLKLLTLSLICSFAMGQNQIQIDSVKGSNRDAIRITYAGDDGVHINSTGGDGFYINSAGSDGFQVLNAGDHGIYVYAAGGWSMNIQGDKNNTSFPYDHPETHIAQIYNRSTGTSPDVLALKVATDNPDGRNNFITFFWRWTCHRADCR